MPSLKSRSTKIIKQNIDPEIEKIKIELEVIRQDDRIQKILKIIVEDYPDDVNLVILEGKQCGKTQFNVNYSPFFYSLTVTDDNIEDVDPDTYIDYEIEEE